ncbi:MAG TPA: hypothetical protein VIV57_04245, partial [Anaeromyxobacter sp.]
PSRRGRRAVTTAGLAGPSSSNTEDAMTSKTSLPFAAVRTSKDHGLAAFAAALLAAFALSAGAFLPRIEASAAHEASARASSPAYAAAEKAPAKRG